MVKMCEAKEIRKLERQQKEEALQNSSKAEKGASERLGFHVVRFSVLDYVLPARNVYCYSRGIPCKRKG